MDKITKIEGVTVENNFEEAQEIFSMSDCLEYYSVERVYRERTEDAKSFEGTYEFNAVKEGEYEQFKKIMSNQLNNIELVEKLKNKYADNGFNTEELVSRLDHREVLEIINRWMPHDIIECVQNEKLFKERCEYFISDGALARAGNLRDAVEKLKKELAEKLKKSNYQKALQLYEQLDFNVWQTGKLENGQKLGKTMLKSGFGNDLLDFYSSQIKEEEKYYITISGAVQMVAGISNHAKAGSWNGYCGTSCQDTRHNSGMEINLLGNLYDKNLVSIMLHKELEDLEDMQDKLVARATARVFYHDEVAVLVPNRIYGNNVTSDSLSYGLKLLAGLKVGIMREQYDRTGGYSNSITVLDNSRQTFEGSNSSLYHADYSGYYTINYTCPVCCGDGEVIASNQHGNENYFTCPLCGGDGEIEDEIEVGWREGEIEEELDDEEMIGSYQDGSLDYCWNHVSIRVNELELMEQVMAVIDAEIKKGELEELEEIERLRREEEWR